MTNKSTDIVIGISTKDCAATITDVLKAADQGLTGYFPEKRGLLVVSDGFSTDGTRELAEATPTEHEKIVLTERGDIGKGSAVKTIFEIAREWCAPTVALVDGDLTSIEPAWIKRLAEPIIAGNDLVVPYYLRHRYDGVITNQIAYPLTNVLFGLGVRQPIGGEYGLSDCLVERLLSHPLFPAAFGIDIFMTLVAAAEGTKIVEAVLGIKEHESTKQYADPETLLVPMFYQVVGSLFRLISHYRSYIKAVDAVRQVERWGEIPSVRPQALVVDKVGIYRQFHAKYDELVRGKSAFLTEVDQELERVYAAPPEEFQFPLALWVKAVYLAINAFTIAQDLAVLDVLRVLWQGRFLSLVKETETMSDEEAETHIQEQIDVFRKYRHLLVEK